MKRSLWVVMWILCIEIIVVLVFIPGNFMELILKNEASLIDTYLGVETKNHVHLQAQRWYRSLMLDSGVYESIHYFLIPTEEQRANSRGMENFGLTVFQWVEHRLEAIGNVVYLMLTRISLILLWLPFMLLMLIPSLYDGYMTWKIKCTSFAYVSPVLHQLSIRGTMFLFFLILITLFIPFVVPPFFTPIFLLLACLLSGMMLSNMQKRF